MNRDKSDELINSDVPAENPGNKWAKSIAEFAAASRAARQRANHKRPDVPAKSTSEAATAARQAAKHRRPKLPFRPTHGPGKGLVAERRRAALRAYVESRFLSWEKFEKHFDPDTGLYEVSPLIEYMTGKRGRRRVNEALKENPKVREVVYPVKLKRKGRVSPAGTLVADPQGLLLLLKHVGRSGSWKEGFACFTAGKGIENFKRAYVDAPANDPDFQCFFNHCPRVFPNTPDGHRNYCEHVYNHHGQYKKLACADADPSWPKCDSCMRLFSSAKAAEHHALVCPTVYPKGRVCEECRTWCVEHNAEGKPVDVVLKKGPCKVVLKTSAEFKEHCARVHSKDAYHNLRVKAGIVTGHMCRCRRDWDEPMCTRVFRTAAEKRKHQENCPKANRVRCFKCGNNYKNMGSIRVHVCK